MNGNPNRKLNRKSTIPTAEALKAWFGTLTSRQRVAIDWMFNDRTKYRDYVRESVRRQAKGRVVDASAPMGGNNVSMFKSPDDVFVSPNDGKPFLIGSNWIDFPADGYAHDNHIIITEQDGVESFDNRFLEKRKAISCIGFQGIVDLLHRPIR